MHIIVLDTSFKAVHLIDDFKSLIWTDRYQEAGDFELYLAMSPQLLEYIKQDYYLYLRESEHVMIIEHILITTDPENGDYMTVTGRSLEAILDRRIIIGQKRYTGNVQTSVRSILNECIISPTDTSRKISNFIFKESTDSDITEFTMDAQYTGDNLYDILCSVCINCGFGFKITLNASNQFVFELYKGKNRSYNQTEFPYVIFSPKFENMIDASYIETKMLLKTVAWVAGEGEGSDRKSVLIDANGTSTGLNRRELYVDARDLSSMLQETDAKHPDGKLTDEEYEETLVNRGIEKLLEATAITSFEGEVDASRMFTLGKDFFIGDVVQVTDAYGNEGTVVITEIIYSQDETGVSIYPTFSTL